MTDFAFVRDDYILYLKEYCGLNSLFGLSLSLPPPLLNSSSATLLFGLQHTTQALHINANHSTTEDSSVNNNNNNNNNARHTISKEEELLRERMRKFTNGVTQFQVSQTSQNHTKVLIPAFGNLFTIELSPEKGLEHPEIYEIKGDEPRIDAKWSPDAQLVTFVRNNDLWAADIAQGKEYRLTFEAPLKVAGVAEFIMQEEFDRFTGYFWAPQIASANPADNIIDGRPITHRILYTVVDERNVADFYISEPTKIDGGVEKSKYPVPGNQNAVTELFILEFNLDILREKPNMIRRRCFHLAQRFPGTEYVPRLGWTPCGRSVYIQLLDRLQQTSTLLLVDIASFIATGLGNPILNDCGIRILWKETSPCWINVTDNIAFTPSGNIIWASEQNGEGNYRHLYEISVSSGNINQITSGNWQLEDLIAIHPTKPLIFFTATKDSPLRRQLYACCLNTPNAPLQLLTSPLYDHETIAMNEACTHFISTCSNAKTRPAASLFSLSYDLSNNISVSEGIPIHQFSAKSPTENDIEGPEFFDFRSSSTEETLYGGFIKPVSGSPPYPTIIHVYGGPHVQVIQDSYGMALNSPKSKAFARAGFLVASIDNTGSARRGRKFESYIYLRLGHYEVLDQIDGVKELIKKGLADPNRIGISGWSYGGYMALMCLAKEPTIFKVGVSGAPVTMWEAYDTGYTERYLSTPEKNQEGYKQSSVVELASAFPSEENRLLILHGLKDDNVHFCHTANLIEALVHHQKPYHLCVFPRERHGCRTFETSRYAENKIVSFFKKNL